MSEPLLVPNESRPKHSVLLLAGIVAVALIAVCAVCGIGFAGAASNLAQAMLSPSDNSPALYDLASDDIVAMYSELNADDRVTRADVNFEWYAGPENSQETSCFLTIDVSTPLVCSSDASDPCGQLVDDIARMVFRHYRKVDKLAGLTVSITRHTTVGNVDYSETPMAKSLSIPNWKKILGIESPAVSQ